MQHFLYTIYVINAKLNDDDAFVKTKVATNLHILKLDFYAQDILQRYVCRTPTLTKCGGEAQHLEKSGVGVLRDSRMFRAQQQGPKHLALGCSWCHWKGLEV